MTAPSLLTNAVRRPEGKIAAAVFLLLLCAFSLVLQEAFLFTPLEGRGWTCILDREQAHHAFIRAKYAGQTLRKDSVFLYYLTPLAHETPIVPGERLLSLEVRALLPSQSWVELFWDHSAGEDRLDAFRLSRFDGRPSGFFSIRDWSLSDLQTASTDAPSPSPVINTYEHEWLLMKSFINPVTFRENIERNFRAEWRVIRLEFTKEQVTAFVDGAEAGKRSLDGFQGGFWGVKSGYAPPIYVDYISARIQGLNGEREVFDHFRPALVPGALAHKAFGLFCILLASAAILALLSTRMFEKPFADRLAVFAAPSLPFILIPWLFTAMDLIESRGSYQVSLILSGVAAFVVLCILLHGQRQSLTFYYDPGRHAAVGNLTGSPRSMLLSSAAVIIVAAILLHISPPGSDYTNDIAVFSPPRLAAGEFLDLGDLGGRGGEIVLQAVPGENTVVDVYFRQGRIPGREDVVWYAFRFSTDPSEKSGFYKCEGPLDLKPVSVPPDAPLNLKLDIVGNRFQAIMNGAVLDSLSDGEYTGAGAGMVVHKGAINNVHVEQSKREHLPSSFFGAILFFMKGMSVLALVLFVWYFILSILLGRISKMSEGFILNQRRWIAAAGSLTCIVLLLLRSRGLLQGDAAPLGLLVILSAWILCEIIFLVVNARAFERSGVPFLILLAALFLAATEAFLVNSDYGTRWRLLRRGVVSQNLSIVHEPFAWNLYRGSIEFRGAETHGDYLPGNPVIIFQGASNVYGAGVGRDEETFVSRFSGAIAPVIPDAAVYNSGRLGYSAQDSALLLRHHIIPGRPDVVIMFSGAVDGSLPWWRLEGDGRGGDTGPPAPGFRSRLADYLGRVRLLAFLRSCVLDLKVRFLNATPESYVLALDHYKGSLREIAAMCRENGITLYFAPDITAETLWDFPASARGEYYRALLDVAREENVPVIDLVAVASKKWHDDNLLLDVIHQNPEGHRRIGRVISEYFLEHQAHQNWK